MAMTIDIKITGLNLFSGKASGTTKPLCYADVALPDLGLTLEGVMLGAYGGKVVARPPSAKLTAGPDRYAVSWGYSSPIGDAMRDAILPAYLAIGGELPEKITHPSPRTQACAGLPGWCAMPTTTRAPMCGGCCAVISPKP